MMNYKKINENHINIFQSIVGEQYVFVDDENLERYGQDETENLIFYPEVVVKPRTPEEISQLLKFCNQENIPITPRGAGTGLSGGALPINK